MYMYYFVIGAKYLTYTSGLMSLCCSDIDDDDDNDDDDDICLLIPLFRVIQAPRVNQGHEVPQDGKWVTFVEWSLCYTPIKHIHVLYVPVQ